eukprot:11275614-Heterocapsa_arctica.AAC.1
MGAGRGADIAGWMGALEAEVAAAKGYMSFGAFIDCDKCYDNIPIQLLLTEGIKHGEIGRLVALA